MVIKFFYGILSFLIFLSIFSLNSLLVFGLEKKIIWQKTYGGDNFDISSEIICTKENNFLVVGNTNSQGAGNSDAWVIKLDQTGNIIWEKTYGSQANDGANSIIETVDNGYIICGYTWSQSAKKDDGWIFKIDGNGIKIWEKVYGGKSFDKLFSIIKDSEDNYIAIGTNSSHGGGNSDAWVLKFDQEGNLIWDKTYGKEANEGAYSVIETYDRGYIICGYVWSEDKKDDGWIFKIDRNGRKIWEKTYGSINSDRLVSVIKSWDQGYIATGFADRNSCSLCDEQGYIWVINLSEEGELTWERKFGGSVYDMAYKVIQSQEGYILVGRTKLQSSKTFSAWLLKVDKKGNVLDDLVITNNKDNYFKSIATDKDGGNFFILGDTWFETSGMSDLWLLKIHP